MTTGDDRAAVQPPANSSAVVDDEADKAPSLVVDALTSQAALDKLMVSRVAAVPVALMDRKTDWNGLTAEQERKTRDEREHIEALYREWTAELDENERRYQKLLDELTERRDEIGKHIEVLKGNAIRMSDGRLAYPTADGGFVYIDDDGTKTALEAEKLEEAKQKYEANGRKNTKAEDLKKAIDGRTALTQEISKVEAERAQNAAVQGGLAASGSDGDKAAAVSRATQDRIDAEEHAKAAVEATANIAPHAAATAAAVINESDDDFYATDGSYPSADANKAAGSDHTSYANQVNPTSGLSSKAAFAAVSVPASSAAAPDMSVSADVELQKKQMPLFPGAQPA